MAIRKYYLLMLLGMAANMFVVNDVKAMEGTNGETLNIQNENGDSANVNNENTIKKNTHIMLNKLIYSISYINLAASLGLSVINNFHRLWEYNKGPYSILGCFGYLSKKFLKNSLQIGSQVNLGRGFLWTTINIINDILASPIIYTTMMLMLKLCKNKPFLLFKYESDPQTKNLISNLRLIENASKLIPLTYKIVGWVVVLIAHFISVPLVIHFSNNFSILISIDSIIWAIINNIMLWHIKKIMSNIEEECINIIINKSSKWDEEDVSKYVVLKKIKVDKEISLA